MRITLEDLHGSIRTPSAAHVPIVHGLEHNTARVGLTFRYVRRSFLELKRRRTELDASVLKVPLPLPAPLDVVDAIWYGSDGTPSTAHLYTYPAIVLEVDASTRCLTLHYLSDGLISESDEEGFAIREGVPVNDVTLATSDVRRWVCHSECPWTRRSFRRVEEIRTKGAAAFLHEWKRNRMRSPDSHAT
jgi:hypothetical protein